MTKSVLAIGEILIDVIAIDGATSLESAETFTARAGGSPANMAVAAARQGLSAAFCGVCGNDAFGRKLRGVLRDNRVDAAALRTDATQPTSLAFAWKDERGDGKFELLRLADAELSVADIEAAAISDRAAVMTCSVSLPTEKSRRALYRAAELADHAGVPFCFDINARPTQWASPGELATGIEPLLGKTTLLKLSLDDAQVLLGEAIAPEEIFVWARGFGIKHMALTDGSRGSWFGDGDGNPVFVPPFPIEAVEPTGAGDAYTASLIGGLIANQWRGITPEIARFASAAGALTASRTGAIDSLPTHDEIAAFLHRQPAST